MGLRGSLSVLPKKTDLNGAQALKKAHLCFLIERFLPRDGHLAFGIWHDEINMT